MIPSTDVPVSENTEQRTPWNPAGINLRYTPPAKDNNSETIVTKARNGRDPKENIKKFY